MRGITQCLIIEAKCGGEHRQTDLPWKVGGYK